MKFMLALLVASTAWAEGTVPAYGPVDLGPTCVYKLCSVREGLLGGGMDCVEAGKAPLAKLPDFTKLITEQGKHVLLDCDLRGTDAR